MHISEHNLEQQREPTSISINTRGFAFAMLRKQKSELIVHSPFPFLCSSSTHDQAVITIKERMLWFIYSETYVRDIHSASAMSYIRLTP